MQMIATDCHILVTPCNQQLHNQTHYSTSYHPAKCTELPTNIINIILNYNRTTDIYTINDLTACNHIQELNETEQNWLHHFSPHNIAINEFFGAIILTANKEEQRYLLKYCYIENTSLITSS